MDGTTTLADLSDRDRTDVQAVLAAVETAAEPVPATAFRALHDPALRTTVEGCLNQVGRTLIDTGRGYLSGYHDKVAQRLAADGIGVLDPPDRAVLTLVLLHSVAIPRSRGDVDSRRWTSGKPVSKAELYKSKLPNKTIDAAVQRLRDAGILGYGPGRSIMPGPQFERLTQHASDVIWEGLILVAAPHGLEAEIIRRRRSERRVDAPAPAETSEGKP